MHAHACMQVRGLECVTYLHVLCDLQHPEPCQLCQALEGLQHHTTTQPQRSQGHKAGQGSSQTPTQATTAAGQARQHQHQQ